MSIIFNLKTEASTKRLNYQLLLPQFDRQTLNKSGELVLKWVQGVKIIHHQPPPEPKRLLNK